MPGTSPEEPTHEMYSFEHTALWADELSRPESLHYLRAANIAISNIILQHSGMPPAAHPDAAKLERWQYAADKHLNAYAAKSPADSLQGQ